MHGAVGFRVGGKCTLPYPRGFGRLYMLPVTGDIVAILYDLAVMRVRVLAAAAVALIAAAYYAWVKQCPGLESLKGKVVLITGTSSGIGAELAIQYGRLGCALVVAARRKNLLEVSAQAAREAGSADVLAVPTDMSSREQVEQLINATVARHGRIDVLILNHASVDDKLLLEHTSLESVQKGLETVIHSNLFGSAYATYAAMPYLEKSRGHIAVISSASANIPAPFHSAYVASKRAINGFFDTVRHEINLAHRKVTIGIQVRGVF
jgi:NAD(P)-dependent dehydrogenase (short-subunit alcohol dehydrogenase family)